ncbi:MAG: molybdenum ABC transporter ATP-binding protein [Moraxellaceae bacterium]|nr:MAG: molybdenum ABC transporter ATP-binding protein [Moraxellaceae bacterium]
MPLSVNITLNGQSVSDAVNITRGSFSLTASFNTPSKGITAIYGPSGSGKTTLLRAVAGLEQGVTGWITLDGKPWLSEELSVPTHQRGVGYVFQRSHLFTHLSVKNNLLYGQKRTPKDQRKIAFEEAVSLLGVDLLIDQPVDSLSGGQRQRVAIARTLLASPKLLLMDEPLAALDHQSKSEILPYLEQLHQSLSIPILYVSHATDEIARLADHIVLMKDGNTYKHGPLLETVSDIDTPLAEQADAFSILEGEVNNGTEGLVSKDELDNLIRIIDVEGHIFRIPTTMLTTNPVVRIRILAKDVSLCLDRPLRTSILNVLPVMIVEIKDQPQTGQCIIKLALGSQFVLARISLFSKQHLGLRVGDAVFAQVKAVALVR